METNLTMLIACGVCLAAGAGAYGMLAMRDLHTYFFCAQIDKLMRADNRFRALKLCNAAPRALSARLTAFLMALEIPSMGAVADQGSRGYREAVTSRSFSAELDGRIDEELATLRRLVNVRALLVLGPMLLALVFGALAALGELTGSGQPEHLRYLSYVAAGAPVLGIAFGLRLRSKLMKGFDIVLDTVKPLLRPAEEMSDDAIETARVARKGFARFL